MLVTWLIVPNCFSELLLAATVAVHISGILECVNVFKHAYFWVRCAVEFERCRLFSVC